MEIPYIIIPYNKNDVEEGIINIQELINIFHSRSIFEQEKSNNSATCETLRQFSLKKLIEVGEVDWTKIYIKLNFNDLNRCIDLSYIDLVISSESYPFLKEEIPKNTDLCHNLLFCGKLKLRNKFCKNCMEIF